MKGWKGFSAAAAGVFLGTLALGCFCVRSLPFGYTECALLYHSAVIAVSALWIGRNK